MLAAFPHTLDSIIDHPLPYVARLLQRPIEDVDLVVIHCTELPDLETARQFGERIQDAERETGFSGHYYIDRDGAVHRYAPDACVAHHTRGFNSRSVGIELVNRGRYPNWFDSRTQTMTEAYPAGQIEALVQLLRILCAHLPALSYIAGHEELDRGRVAASDAPDVEVFRKRDPGPMFPWVHVIDASGLRRIGGDGLPEAPAVTESKDD